MYFCVHARVQARTDWLGLACACVAPASALRQGVLSTFKFGFTMSTSAHVPIIHTATSVRRRRLHSVGCACIHGSCGNAELPASDGALALAVLTLRRRGPAIVVWPGHTSKAKQWTQPTCPPCNTRG